MTVAIAASTIVQQAFRFMELRSPSSFADDSDQANAATQQYDNALAVCLEAYDWSFASTIAALSETILTSAADPRLPYTFALPDDCLVLREVLADGAAYRADKGALRTDQAAPLTIRYTSTIVDETAMPATFRTAVALQLAVFLAPLFVEVQSKIDRLSQQLSEAMRMAARTDGRTASPTSYSFAGSPGDWSTEATR